MAVVAPMTIASVSMAMLCEGLHVVDSITNLGADCVEETQWIASSCLAY